MTQAMPDVEITLGVGYVTLVWVFVWRWGLCVFMSVLRIFWAGEQMVAAVLIAILLIEQKRGYIAYCLFLVPEIEDSVVISRKTLGQQ